MNHSLVQHLSGIGEDSFQRLGCERRVVLEYLLICPARSEEAQHEIAACWPWRPT